MFDINKTCFASSSLHFGLWILKNDWVDCWLWSIPSGKTFLSSGNCIAKCQHGACNLFYIYYQYPIENWTICFQYEHHGLDWHDGNISLGRALKAITKWISEKDTVIIKGEQKIKFFVSHGVMNESQIVSVEESPTLRELVKNVEHKCAKHTNLKKFWCAQQKCFAIHSYIKCLEKEEEEKHIII